MMKVPDASPPSSAFDEKPSVSNRTSRTGFSSAASEIDESARLRALNCFDDEKRYPYEIERAIQNVKFVHHCWKIQDQYDEVRGDGERMGERMERGWEHGDGEMLLWVNETLGGV